METAMMSLREVYGCLEQEGKVHGYGRGKNHLQTAAEQETFQEWQALKGKDKYLDGSDATTDKSRI